MKLLFTFSILICSMIAQGQDEPLYQRDSAGKKNGRWIVYLDARGRKVDSGRAVFYRYTWFDHGVNVYPMGAGGKKNWKMVSSTDTSKQPGKIKLLDGEYKWYDTKGRLIYEHVLKNGEYISYKEYYKTGALLSHFDYTDHWQGQVHSWFIRTYDRKGNITYEGYVAKDEKGRWPAMRG